MENGERHTKLAYRRVNGRLETYCLECKLVLKVEGEGELEDGLLLYTDPIGNHFLD